MPPNYRRCVSCRRVGPKTEFWRLVRVHPDRTVQLGDGMGRSAYLCPQADCLRQAQKKRRLGRALKANVPEELYQTLWQRLETAVADPGAGTT
ncbi:YlxR family protein [Nodosilinea sp. LEGE 06152]|uniref:YlxR family protein n=1 Tax=Nodosilinea sp. LEGE 06152 TaxID=2777966 RepID=UPI00188182E8|nr:YlxR family protein [Nodosilinea sp. LEGE 06152]MBE9159696.1 YlxR family protein [Nodosilinea sp. LEGE 06152]